MEFEKEGGKKAKAQVAALEGRIANLEEQLDCENKERNQISRTSRRLEKKIREMMMQVRG